MSRVGLAVILATVAGLGVTLGLLAKVGYAAVFGIIGRVGLPGFIAYVGLTLLLLVVLGAAHAIIAGRGGQLPLFIWSRTTREAATDVLPFAQAGGILVGARSLIARGVPARLTWASLVADQTSELAAQLVYTLYGVAALFLVLQGRADGGELARLALLGLGASIAVILLFVLAQRPMLALAGRIAGTMLPGSAAAFADVEADLATLYRRRGALVASFLLHLLAWVASGAGAWFGLQLLGVGVSLGNVIIVESLIFTLRTAAFLVPGAIGLQEGAYLLLAPLFGLSPEAALALSLLKRARDLALGLPVMLAWQIGEGRRLGIRR
jgi:putative membrane protein